jgi:hypothetical protein
MNKRISCGQLKHMAESLFLQQQRKIRPQIPRNQMCFGMATRFMFQTSVVSGHSNRPIKSQVLCKNNTSIKSELVMQKN